MTNPQNPFMEHWPQAAKMSMEPLMELNGITTRMCTDIARQNLKTMNDIMQCHAEQMQGMSHARGMEDMINAYSRWCAKVSAPLTQHTQNVLDTMLESASEYSKWWEKGLHHMSQQTKTMQEKAEKVMKHSQPQHHHQDKK